MAHTGEAAKASSYDRLRSPGGRAAVGCIGQQATWRAIASAAVMAISFAALVEQLRNR